MTNAGNTFDTVNFTGGNIAWAETGPVTIGATGVSATAGTTSTGTLAITSTGALTQTGAVTAADVTTLAAGAGNNITLNNAANDFSTVGITSGNNVALTDANALILGASTVSGTLGVTTGGALTQSGVLAVTGATTFTATAANTDMLLDTQANNFGGVVSFAGTPANIRDVQLRNVNAGATVPVLAGLTNLRNLTLTFDTAPMTVPTLMASGNVNLTAGTDVTLGLLSAGGGVNVTAGGSVLSAGGPGTNVTASASSRLEAFNGVVGTQAAPVTVNVNPGMLSIRATTAVAGISAFLTGTVASPPGNMLTLLNVPPGLVCFNGCPVPPSNNPFGIFFGSIPLFSRDSIVPWYIQEPSDPPLVSIVSTYVPGTVVAEAKTDVKSDGRSVAREIPPCFPRSACRPGAGILTAPAGGQDPELTTAR